MAGSEDDGGGVGEHMPASLRSNEKAKDECRSASLHFSISIKDKAPPVSVNDSTLSHQQATTSNPPQDNAQSSPAQPSTMARSESDSEGAREGTQALSPLSVTSAPSLDAVEHGTTARQPDVFPWFRLPAELRNRIYALAGKRVRPRILSTTNRPTSNADIPALHLSPMPVTPASLVSKRFHREYTTELKVMADMLEFTPSSDPNEPAFFHSRGNIVALQAASQRSKHVHTLILELATTHYKATNRGHYLGTLIDLVKHDVSTILATLPQLHKIIIRYQGHMELQGRYVMEEFSVQPRANILAETYVPTTSTDSIAIETEILLRYELYTPYPNSIWAAHHAIGLENWVVYRGVTSENSTAWWGLDLEVVRCGKFTEGDLAEMKARAAAAAALRRPEY